MLRVSPPYRTTTTDDDFYNRRSPLPFPASTLARLTNLNTLELPYHQFTGTLPADMWGQLSLLQRLDLSHNRLEGPLPTQLGQQLPQLQSLDLHHNRLTGSLLLPLDSLVNLQVLQLQDNRFAGPLPSLEQAVQLHHVFLQRNRLTGTIPETFLQQHHAATTTTTTTTDADAVGVVTINLESNQLGGRVPETLARFDKLNLHLAHNTGGWTEPLPRVFATKAAWMNGQVAEFGTDAILCGAGSFEPTAGRQSSVRSPCAPCHEEPSSQELGRTQCGATLYNGNNNNNDPYAQQVRVLAQFYLALRGHTRWLHTDGWETLDALLFPDNGDVYHDSAAVMDIASYDVDFSGIDACQWHGILCNAQGHVEVLTLPKNHMVGTVPNDIFYLPFLQSLDLSQNLVQVDSFAPLQFTPKLSRLQLSHTAVRSWRGIGRAADQLHELWLDGCDLSEEKDDNDDPATMNELYQLTNLHTLHLEGCNLAGTLSPDVGRLSNLKQYVRS